MRFTQVLAAATALTVLGTVPTLAEGPKVYPVPSQANYCPAGLQPVTISGEICCGKPNQAMTYQQVMAQPAVKKRVRKARTPRSARVACPVGSKGCTFD